MKKTTHLNRDSLAAEIRENHRVSESWEKTGEDYKISGGMAYRIAVQGYEPKDAHIRAVLGLPILAPAPVCPKCNVVHVRATCPRVGKRPRWVRDTVGYNDGHMGGGWR